MNLGLIALAVFLGRRVFMVFGALGVTGYLGHLSYTVFRDSVAFPFVLTAIGLGAIAVGVGYQRRRDRIERAATEAMPAWLLRLRPAYRGG